MRLNKNLLILNKNLLIVLLIVTCSLYPFVVKAAMPTVYIRIDGIVGSCEIPNHMEEILVYSFGHNINAPWAVTGSSATKATHGPLEILKECDKSSPNLYLALCEGRHIQKAIIRFYRASQDPSGGEENYFTIELTNVLVTKIVPSLLKEEVTNKHMEIVSFVYGKISWEWKSKTGTVKSGFDVEANKKL